MRSNEDVKAEFDQAEANYDLYQEATTDGAAYVAASNGTGSKYQVVAAFMPGESAGQVGGEILISVVQPWQTCYAVSTDGDLDISYVAEKFLRPGRQMPDVHGGDLQGIYATVNAAIRYLLAGPAA